MFLDDRSNEILLTFTNIPEYIPRFYCNFTSVLQKTFGVKDNLNLLLPFHCAKLKNIGKNEFI